MAQAVVPLSAAHPSVWRLNGARRQPTPGGQRQQCRRQCAGWSPLRQQAASRQRAVAEDSTQDEIEGGYCMPAFVTAGRPGGLGGRAAASTQQFCADHHLESAFNGGCALQITTAASASPCWMWRLGTTQVIARTTFASISLCPSARIQADLFVCYHTNSCVA
jgi:hypothetical protein